MKLAEIAMKRSLSINNGIKTCPMQSQPILSTFLGITTHIADRKNPYQRQERVLVNIEDICQLNVIGGREYDCRHGQGRNGLAILSSGGGKVWCSATVEVWLVQNMLVF